MQKLPNFDKCLLCGQNLTPNKCEHSTFFDCKACTKFETRTLNKDSSVISARIYDEEQGIVITFNFLDDKMRIYSYSKDAKKNQIDLEFPLPVVDWSNSKSALNKINTVLMFR